MFVSCLGGRGSCSPDLALSAILLIFDILKFERAAQLSMDISLGEQTVSLSLFSSLFFFIFEVFLTCFSFAVLRSVASLSDTSCTGAVLHIKQVAPPFSTGKHFSFLINPQVPVE